MKDYDCTRGAHGVRPRHPLRERVRFLLVLVMCVLPRVASAGGDAPSLHGSAHSALSSRETAFLDTLQERTFRWFWDLSDPRTGMTPDRWPAKSFVSVSATGFALTAYPIGAEHGWITREQAARRVLNTLRFFRDLPQDTSRAGAGGYRGFFYHFLDPATGRRFADVELSTMDTALFLAGALFCQSYFDRPGAVEDSIRTVAEELYTRVDWRWIQVRPPTICLGWDPERGHLPYDWRGYNEAMILHLLALGATTNPPEGDVWKPWVSGYRWGEFQGSEHLGFAPLFGHQYTHCWVDFRGIRDAWGRERGLDYFENSRRATLAQRAYAMANPGGWAAYGPLCWGLTACDGPVSSSFVIDGRKREFNTYWARGASFTEINDDGTLAPAAAGGSVAFAPELVVPTLISMRETYGEPLFGKYGFLDAFNPTFKLGVKVQHGRVDPRLGWFDTDYLGIDQGPILIMIENLRSGLVWETMRRNPRLVRGLRAAGFTGGWLEGGGGDR